MASLHRIQEQISVNELLDQATNLLAEKIAEKLKPQIHYLVQGTRSVETSPAPTRPAPGPRRLWSLEELAKDSGLSKSTWYKWVYQRKVPVVRLGRAVRVRDSDYQRLIQRSFSPEVRLGPDRQD